VSLAEADANEPINHRGELQEGEDSQEDGVTQESGKDLLLAEEERPCGNKESEILTPSGTRDSWPAGNAAASEDVEVSGGGGRNDLQDAANKVPNIMNGNPHASVRTIRSRRFTRCGSFWPP
jgi:hypothetical protein